MTHIVKTYTEFAASAAEAYSKIVEYRDKIEASSNEVSNKYQNGFSRLNIAERASAAEVIKEHYELIINAYREILFILERIRKTYNKPLLDDFRSAAVGMVGRKHETDGYPQNLDETKINLSPDVTGVRFVEYTYDAATFKFEGTVNERESDYRVRTIVDQWIPILPSYFDQIGTALTIHLLKTTDDMREEYNRVYDILATFDTKSEVEMVFDANGPWVRHLDTAISRCQQLYQVFSNVAKNIELINKAFEYYLNRDNYIYSI